MIVFVKEYDRKADAIVTNAILMPAGEVREDRPLPPYVYTENAAWGHRRTGHHHFAPSC